MTIHLINPNSSEAVTAAVDRAIDPMRAASPVAISCHTLAEGPPGIETQAHVESVSGPLLDRAARLEEEDTSAFVIACFSDPGLAALREQSAHPVVGIAEAAILTAMTMGQKFGIISILGRSIPRHLRYVGAMGVTDRLAGDLALELGVADLSDEGRTFARMRDIGAQLRDAHGAEVLILGCAGMSDYRARLEDAIGCPVIDPSQAAIAFAIGQVASARMRTEEQKKLRTQ